MSTGLVLESCLHGLRVPVVFSSGVNILGNSWVSFVKADESIIRVSIGSSRISFSFSHNLPFLFDYIC